MQDTSNVLHARRQVKNRKYQDGDDYLMADAPTVK
jgi:hypothetical protein